MNAIIEALTTYYGLDWLTMCLGLCGTYMIIQGKRHGFLLSSLACICGLTVATMSHQTGYIAYNLILTAMMARGFVNNGQRQAAT